MTLLMSEIKREEDSLHQLLLLYSSSIIIWRILFHTLNYSRGAFTSQVLYLIRFFNSHFIKFFIFFFCKFFSIQIFNYFFFFLFNLFLLINNGAKIFIFFFFNSSEKHSKNTPPLRNVCLCDSRKFHTTRRTGFLFPFHARRLLCCCCERALSSLSVDTIYT